MAPRNHNSSPIFRGCSRLRHQQTNHVRLLVRMRKMMNSIVTMELLCFRTWTDIESRACVTNWKAFEFSQLVTISRFLRHGQGPKTHFSIYRMEQELSCQSLRFCDSPTDSFRCFGKEVAFPYLIGLFEWLQFSGYYFQCRKWDKILQD